MRTSLSKGYLTSKQRQMWERQSTGLRPVSVARELGVSRQAVHKVVVIANSKVRTSLEEAAKISRIRVEDVDPANGLLRGYSVHFKTKAFITFSPGDGVQVWYKRQGDCKSCEQLHDCRKTLLALARYQKVQLPRNSTAILPSTLAKTVFSQLMARWNE